MNPKPLTPDQTEALHAAGDQPLRVIDPTNQTVYFLVNEHMLSDIAAIQAGIDDMEAGRVSPVDESFAEIRRRLTEKHGE